MSSDPSSSIMNLAQLLDMSRGELVHPLQQYHNLMAYTLHEGTRQANRTGVDAISVPGAMMRFDLRDGFPAVTTKKLAFRSLVGELLSFFRGYQSAAQFREMGCKFWDANANQTASWLPNPHRKGQDDLGRIYGAQWTDWRDWREVRNDEDFERHLQLGYELIASDPSRGVRVMRRGINQLENALTDLLVNPTSRRIIITGWRPDEADQYCIPTCHMSYQFIANVERNELHLCMYQRSCDQFLGVPMNIAESALMLEIMARLSGFQAATFTHFLADAHIYVNHIEQVQTQLTRGHFPSPTLKISENVREIEDVADVKGAFERIELADIELVGYQSHGALVAQMAA
jgi:thymidylate synthase